MFGLPQLVSGLQSGVPTVGHSGHYYNYSSPQWQAGKQWWQAWVLPSFPQHAAATTG